MAHLTLAGRTPDGTRLRLVDDDGVEHTLDVDPRLTGELAPELAAASGATASSHPRTRPLEAQMDSTLRPRDIQARIRAGETAEDVARAAQTTVEKVMPFAAPVLAERAHMAERAQGSSVRRRSGESGARTLGEAVAARLRPLNLDPAGVEWDAWRREDGRWTLVGAFATERRSGSATFSFDHRGNYVTLDDDDARWLVGELVDEPEPEAAPEPAAPARRLAAVPAHDPDQLELGDDAISLVEEPAAPGSPATTPATTAPAAPADDDETVELEATPAEPAQPAEPAEPAESPSAEPASDPADGEPEAPAARRGRRRGRASVPSWDEIMFGGGKQE